MINKKLLLVSALAVSGAACAQSSVTLFGVIDTTIARGSGSVANRTRLASGGQVASRLGFRGTEDLGGGWSAGFWLEAALGTDDGTGAATNVNNQATGGAPSCTVAGAAAATCTVALNGAQGLAFGRRSRVNLTGPWGELRMGRDFNPQYWSLLYGDPFGNSGVGSAVNFTQSIAGVLSVRSSNAIEYVTPNWSGVVAQVMHYRGENPSNAVNASDGTGTAMRVAYDRKPFNVGVAYAKTSYRTGDLTQRNINAGWDFGMVRVIGDLNRDSLGAIDARGGALSAIALVGVGEIKASYSFHKTNALFSPEAKKFAVGYVHNLSKRTSLYGTLARVHNSGGSAVALNAATTAANQSSSGFDLGLRHNF